MMEIRGCYITLQQVWANRHKVDGAKTNTELVKSTLFEDLYHDSITSYVFFPNKNMRTLHIRHEYSVDKLGPT